MKREWYFLITGTDRAPWILPSDRPGGMDDEMKALCTGPFETEDDAWVAADGALNAVINCFRRARTAHMAPRNR